MLRSQTFWPIEPCKIVEGWKYSEKFNERQVTALLTEECLKDTGKMVSKGYSCIANSFDSSHKAAASFPFLMTFAALSSFIIFHIIFADC
ncbi:Protein argonaute 1 [Melia azedarach]|uniref:Protein argonaute 1 n=1 Tax=Melia azedarach TaxID=155640 RepID=A0ACC1X2K0_MELAZ|nr:Protein argonaute 1 [Melia azedarach]